MANYKKDNPLWKKDKEGIWKPLAPKPENYNSDEDRQIWTWVCSDYWKLLGVYKRKKLRLKLCHKK